jgi:hypothetical protein
MNMYLLLGLPLLLMAVGVAIWTLKSGPAKVTTEDLLGISIRGGGQ